MFKALVESDEEDTPAIAKELAARATPLMVTWTELGLSGIRKLPALFDEFAGGNEAVKQLSRSRGLAVFDPVPYLWQSIDDNWLFVAEPTQPRVFEAWRKQLAVYRDSLLIP